MRSRTHFVTIALLSLATLLGALSAHAQEITGTIRGTITDPTGAVIPGATVILVDTGKKLEVRRVTTNKSGEYVAPLLPVGKYEIDVEGTGFKRASQKNVVAMFPTGSKRTLPSRSAMQRQLSMSLAIRFKCSCRTRPQRA